MLTTTTAAELLHVQKCPVDLSTTRGMETNITLWQFLLELLLSNQYTHIISWTNNDGEFKLVNAEEVARLWGLRKNKHNMNYDKLSRALRYYYDKNIIKKVLGQKFVYRFVSFPEIVKTENKIPFHVKMEAIHKTPYKMPYIPPPHQPAACPSPDMPEDMSIKSASFWSPLTIKEVEIKRRVDVDDDSSHAATPEDYSSSEVSSSPASAKRFKTETDSESCPSPAGSNRSATPVTISKPKPKPPPIVPATRLTAVPSLQTPVVTFSSPFLLQNKTPVLAAFPFWGSLSPSSPRGTHFQFPSHVGFPPLSPFLGHPFTSPFDPQAIFSPSKSISVFQ